MRCFIALPLPPEARAALARAVTSLRDDLSGLSWTGSEGYHLTIAFLGEIEEGTVRLAAAALDAAAGFGDIPFSFEGLGAFPPTGRLRVLFARLAEGGRSAELHRRVIEALGRMHPEWPGGPAFAPHVTLARAGRRGESASLSAGDPPSLAGAWTIGRCSLYKSELRRGGSVYTELRGVELAI